MNPIQSLPKLSLSAATLIFSNATHADLVGHWAFDEGAGTVASDSSGQGNDGTITNCEWGSDETRDNYLIFNGTDSIVDPAFTQPVMTLANDFTWALWVNSQEEINGVQQNAILVGNRYDPLGADYVPRQFVKITTTKFEWHQNEVGTDNLDVADLEVDIWRHIAVVKDGANLEYFIDGVTVGMQALTEAIGTAEHPFFIGGQANNGSVNEHFNGYIDDVRIYDEALSVEEILALITAEPVPPEFSEIAVNAAGDVTLTWDSTPGATYIFNFSNDLVNWNELNDSVPSGGSSTTLTLPNDVFPLDTDPLKLFFQVIKN